MQEEFEVYKIVIIGSSGAGKTNISTRYIRDSFSEVSQATLGVQFMTKEVEVGGRKIKLSLWDTAGQERYKALSKVYYKGACGAIVVYDITDAKSYLDVESWMRLLNENLNLDDVVLALVGNKFDLADRREVSIERPEQEYREAFGVDCWEASAKTGLNIELLFAEMLRRIVDKASDVKSTMYRGTVEYTESQRGTYMGKGDGRAVGVHNPSIIIQEEEDEHREMKKGGSVAGVPSQLTLSPAERKNHRFVTQQNKRRKCCWGG